MERSRFSAAMMRSVEVGIQRSADGHTRAHLDPAGGGTDADAASAAVAAADACLTSSAAAILVVVAAALEAARRMRCEDFPHVNSLRGGSGLWGREIGGLFCSDSFRRGSGLVLEFLFGRASPDRTLCGAKPYVMACVCVPTPMDWGASKGRERGQRSRSRLRGTRVGLSVAHACADAHGGAARGGSVASARANVSSS
jgi:hypothetical protein